MRIVKPNYTQGEQINFISWKQYKSTTDAYESKREKWAKSGVQEREVLGKGRGWLARWISYHDIPGGQIIQQFPSAPT